MVYAILKNQVIEKLVLAEKDTPFEVIFKDRFVVEVNEKTGFPHIGYIFDGKRFIEKGL